MRRLHLFEHKTKRTNTIITSFRKNKTKKLYLLNKKGGVIQNNLTTNRVPVVFFTSTQIMIVQSSSKAASARASATTTGIRSTSTSSTNGSATSASASASASRSNVIDLLHVDFSAMDKIIVSPYEGNQCAELNEPLFEHIKSLMKSVESVDNDDTENENENNNICNSSRRRRTKKQDTFRPSATAIQVFGRGDKKQAEIMLKTIHNIKASGMLYGCSWRDDGIIHSEECGTLKDKELLLLCIQDYRLARITNSKSGELNRIIKDLSLWTTFVHTLSEWKLTIAYPNLARYFSQRKSKIQMFKNYCSNDKECLQCLKIIVFIVRTKICMERLPNWDNFLFLVDIMDTANTATNCNSRNEASPSSSPSSSTLKTKIHACFQILENIIILSNERNDKLRSSLDHCSAIISNSKNTAKNSKIQDQNQLSEYELKNIRNRERNNRHAESFGFGGRKKNGNSGSGSGSGSGSNDKKQESPVHAVSATSKTPPSTQPRRTKQRTTNEIEIVPPKELQSYNKLPPNSDKAEEYAFVGDGERRKRKVPDTFVAETSQDHNSKRNKNKHGNYNNKINSNLTYKERIQTRIGNDDEDGSNNNSNNNMVIKKGFKFQKSFMMIYDGKVISDEPKWVYNSDLEDDELVWEVRYSDGDEEMLTELELEKLVAETAAKSSSDGLSLVDDNTYSNLHITDPTAVKSYEDAKQDLCHRSSLQEEEVVAALKTMRPPYCLNTAIKLIMKARDHAENDVTYHDPCGRKLHMLELFSGCSIVSETFNLLGWSVRSVDNDHNSRASHKVDFMQLNWTDIGYIPDSIWLSPPCITYTKLTAGFHRDPKRDEYAKTPQALLHDRLLARIRWILKWMIQKKPHMIIVIENPVGLLSKMPLMNLIAKDLNLRSTTVHYCTLGRHDQKPTNLWTNDSKLIGALSPFICKPETCRYHKKHPPGVRDNKRFNAAAIPKALAEIVAESVHCTFSVNDKCIRRTTNEPEITADQIEEFNKTMGKDYELESADDDDE